MGGDALVTVDQGLADLHPLAASLRVDTAAHPATDDFVNVYADPALPGRYIRSSGAIHAVFPQSTYAVSNGGVVPTIPPGTVFYFGLPTAQTIPGTSVDLRVPDGTGQATTERITPLRVVHAINMRDGALGSERINRERVGAVREQTPRRTRREAQLTMSDEIHRRERLREIASR